MQRPRAVRGVTASWAGMIDFHNHLIPAVDDGAADLEQALGALDTLWAQGVRGVVTTPHLSGSLTLNPPRLARRLEEMEPGWQALRDAAARRHPGLRLERGAEVMLDAPGCDLAEPRLRLAGTRFALVEFPFMTVPPFSAQLLGALRQAGWLPVLAHPERYGNASPQLDDARAWREAGALLQVNAGSLLGRYGEGPRRLAWGLLARGWADYLGSDFHARGRCALAEARQALVRAGAERQAFQLCEDNPARLLADLLPHGVAPVAPRPSLWRRLLGPLTR
jgi:protein-tyrosine phosphatase